MASGGEAEQSERGHRGRNTELRRSISDMNLSLRRRHGNHASKEPRPAGGAGGGGIHDRKNIMSMIATDSGEVWKIEIEDDVKEKVCVAEWAITLMLLLHCVVDWE